MYGLVTTRAREGSGMSLSASSAPVGRQLLSRALAALAALAAAGWQGVRVKLKLSPGKTDHDYSYSNMHTSTHAHRCSWITVREGCCHSAPRKRACGRRRLRPRSNERWLRADRRCARPRRWKRDSVHAHGGAKVRALARRECAAARARGGCSSPADHDRRHIRVPKLPGVSCSNDATELKQ